MNKRLLTIIVTTIMTILVILYITQDKNSVTGLSEPGSLLSPVLVSSPSPISINYLRTLSIDSPVVVIEEELPRGSNYKRYIASFRSEGNKVYGLLTIPDATTPSGGFPAIIFNHGYIPPAEYETTTRYVSHVDILAKNEFIVFKIDFRGNGKSEGDPSGSYFSSAYTTDAISAVKSLQKYDQVNPNRIGVWGHSMAGNVVLRSMLVSADIKAGVIWAGAVYSYADFAKYRISDNSYAHRPYETKEGITQSNRDISPEIQRVRIDPKSINFDSEYWNSISLSKNINYLNSPLQIHHAVNDSVVDIGYSRDLVDVLKQNAKSHEFYEYVGGGHNLTSPHFETAMERTVKFFKENL